MLYKQLRFLIGLILWGKALFKGEAEELNFATMGKNNG